VIRLDRLLPLPAIQLAGRRGGFDDARHLWPEFRRLIEERRPCKTNMEMQVASAAWTGSDLCEVIWKPWTTPRGAIPDRSREHAGCGPFSETAFWFVWATATARIGVPIEVAEGRAREDSYGAKGRLSRGSNRGIALAKRRTSLRRRQRGRATRQATAGTNNLIRAQRNGGDVSDTERQRVRSERPAAPLGRRAECKERTGNGNGFA